MDEQAGQPKQPQSGHLTAPVQTEASTARDGGPAFPVQDAASWQGHGMSLRDYFAAKAMSAMLTTARGEFGTTEEGRENCVRFSNVSYVMADAMLKAREAA